MNRSSSSAPVPTLEDVSACGSTEEPRRNDSVASKASRLSAGTRVFQNTIVLLGGRAFSLLLSAVASILLARYLGRERMGEYGALYAYLALYSWLSTFCLEQILAREVTGRRSEAAIIFHTGSMVGLSFALVGAILAPLLAPLFGYTGQLRWLIAIAALDLLILPPIRLPGIVFQVDMRQWFSVGIGLVRQVLWLAAIVLLAMRNAAFYQVIVVRTICGILEAGIVLKLCYRPGMVTGPRRFDLSEARRLLRYAFPLAMSAISVGVFYRIDQVMLHNMTGDRALGPYVIAAQLTEQFGALPVALISSLFPVLVQTVHQEEQFRHYLGVSYRFLMSVVFFACAVVTPITAPLVSLLYGKEFLPTAGLINVLIWSEVPLFLGVALTNALIAKNLQRYLPYSTAVGAVMNIGLNLMFIPRWGALGAAWATVISYAVATVLFYLVFQPARAMTWQGLRIALPPFAVALAITWALRHLPVHFAAKILIATLLYATGAWLTGTVRRAEIERLLEIFRGALGFSPQETL
jgi:O-antigen/teichoic acid export membrane protein